MKHEELRDAILSFPELAESESEAACYKVLNSYLKEFTVERAMLAEADDIAELERFRKIVLPVVLESTLCRYIYEKPRGYAGDFITQEMIWFGRTLGGSHRYAGSTKAGEILNSLILGTENCRANEARIKYFRKLAESAHRIASIGSGSAIDFWECSLQDVDIFLLDMDQGALDRAKEKLTQNISVTYTCQNILKFCLGRKKADCVPDRDLVYASGLFDYFDLAGSSQRTGNQALSMQHRIVLDCLPRPGHQHVAVCSPIRGDLPAGGCSPRVPIAAAGRHPHPIAGGARIYGLLLLPVPGKGIP